MTNAELNIAVAEKVMGWKRWKWIDASWSLLRSPEWSPRETSSRIRFVECGPDVPLKDGDCIPDFCGKDVLAVVKRMRELGFFWTSSHGLTYGKYGSLFADCRGLAGEETDALFGRAVCLSAIKAIEENICLPS